MAVAFVYYVEVGERQYGRYSRDLILLDVVPVVVAQEEHFALRVVDYVDDVGRAEVLQDRDYYCAVGYCCEVCYAPTGIVAADEGNFVATFDLGLFEEQVQFGNLLGHFVI